MVKLPWVENLEILEIEPINLQSLKISVDQLTSKLVFGNFLENVDMISECCLDKIFNQNNLKLILSSHRYRNIDYINIYLQHGTH